MATEPAEKNASADLIARVGEGKRKILSEIRKVIIGQEGIVDDVATSGTSLIDGVTAIRAAYPHASVPAVLCVVDRLEGAREAVVAYDPDIEFISIFTRDDLA